MIETHYFLSKLILYLIKGEYQINGSKIYLLINLFLEFEKKICLSRLSFNKILQCSNIVTI